MTATYLDPLDVARRLERLRELRRYNRPRDMYWAGRQGWPEEDRLQLQFHKSTHPIRAMFPGNGAGKTTAAAIEADYWLQRDHPYQPTPQRAVEVIWVCLKFQQMDILRTRLEADALSAGWTWNDQKHRYTWPNGSKMWVISNDGDWGSIQGVAPDLVIIDEECDEELWRELTMRRRASRQTRYIIAATATKGKRWMYREIYTPWLEHHRAAGIDEERAIKQQTHPRIWVWPKGGIDDNPGAAATDKSWYEAVLLVASAGEKQVRLHGGFEDFNAAAVFDLEALAAMEGKNREEKITGVDGSFVQTEKEKRKHPNWPAEFSFAPGVKPPGGGRITIYEQPAEDNYVLGADFGYGLEDRDADAAVVLRQSTGRQVAAANGRWGDVNFAWVLWALGWFYRQALIVGERQVGLPVMRRLYDEWGYAYFYYEKDEQHAAPRFSDLLGHHAAHGDLVIAYLAMDVSPRERTTGAKMGSRLRFTDPQTIEQCRKYEWRPRRQNLELADARNREMKHAAPPGENDDLVMAAAYAALGLRELPKFIAGKPTFPGGSMGQVLKHEEIWRKAQPHPKSTFAHARLPMKR